MGLRRQPPDDLFTKTLDEVFSGLTSADASGREIEERLLIKRPCCRSMGGTNLVRQYLKTWLVDRLCGRSERQKMAVLTALAAPGLLPNQNAALHAAQSAICHKPQEQLL